MDMSFVKTTGLALTALAVAGCASAPVATPVSERPVLEFDDSQFGPRPEIIDDASLFVLTEGQRQAFFSFFNDPAYRHLAEHKRIHRYLEVATTDFDFHSGTLTASEGLGALQGNCMTLAMLTTALAELVDIEVDYQLVESTPVFELTGSVVTKGLHVRSLLYDPTWQPSADDDDILKPRRGIKIDYFPDGTERFVGNLPDAAYVAMYYSNIAGEALAANDIDNAYWHARESLRVAPDNVPALNTMAIAYRRAGDAAMSEQIYRYAIDHLPREISFLRNYRSLLASQGRSEEADAITATLAKLDDPNPFDWISAGRAAYLDGEYREAISYYKRAAKNAPYLHEANVGMALAYLKLGKLERGEDQLREALEKAQRRSTRSLYEAKLTALTQFVSN